jgi:hypothetical protein
MPSVRFNALLDSSHHGLPHPCRDAGVVADSLTGIHDALVKCRLVANTSCIHKGFQASLQAKIKRIEIWRGWRPTSVSFSTCPSVMIGVTENFSHSTT